MTIIQIALSSLMARKMSALVSVLLVASGVALGMMILTFSHHIQTRMGQDGKGFDLVIGAKGSPLQMVLSSIYHIDIPTGNIPQSQFDQWQRHKDVKTAIPLALGDSYKGFRIVGTNHDYPAHYGARIGEGALWSKPFEAVAGASTGLSIGDKFYGAHGLAEAGHAHEEHAYIITGIFKKTGSVIDRLILTDVESVQDLHVDAEHHGHDEHGHQDHAHHAEERDITAILIETRNKIANINLPRQINRGGDVMAANPAYEMTRLSSMMGIGGKTMAVVSGVLFAISFLGLFAGLNAALDNRKPDLAILRAIGFSRGRLIRLVMMEGMVLVAAGIVAGVAAGLAGLHVLISMLPPVQAIGGMGVPWVALAVFCAGVMVCGLVACIIPAWRASKINVAQQLARGV